MTVWSWTFERMLLMAGCMQKMFDIADMNPYITPHRGHSSAGRALEWHSRGQRFDPAWLHQLNHAITSSLITPTKRDCDNFVPYAEELFLKAMPLHLWAAIGSPSFIANGAKVRRVVFPKSSPEFVQADHFSRDKVWLGCPQNPLLPSSRGCASTLHWSSPSA